MITQTKKRITQMHCRRHAHQGVTLVELLMAMLLLSLVFLAMSSLYVAAQKFYFTSTDSVMIGCELQHAIQHIYKNVMRGIGDKNTSPFWITGQTQLDIRIHNNDLSLPPSLQPLTMAGYNNVTDYRYYYNANDLTLMFDSGTPSNLADDESLVSKVKVTRVYFFTNPPNDNVLTGYITAYYKDSTKPSTFYFSCYPRLATFY